MKKSMALGGIFNKRNFRNLIFFVLIGVLVQGCSMPNLSSMPEIPNWIKPSAALGKVTNAFSRFKSKKDMQTEKPVSLADVPKRPKRNSAEKQRENAEGLVADRKNAKYTDEIVRSSDAKKTDSIEVSQKSKKSSKQAVNPVSRLAKAVSKPVISLARTVSRPVRNILIPKESKSSGSSKIATSPRKISSESAKIEKNKIFQKTSKLVVKPKKLEKVSSIKERKSSTLESRRIITTGRKSKSLTSRKILKKNTSTSSDVLKKTKPVIKQLQSRKSSEQLSGKNVVEKKSPITAIPRLGDKASVDNVSISGNAVIKDTYSKMLAQSASKTSITSHGSDFKPSQAKPLKRGVANVDPILRETYNASLNSKEDSHIENREVVLSRAEKTNRNFSNANASKPELIIKFAHDSNKLSASDKLVLKKIAEKHQREGGKIIVVGHASSRTRDMNIVDHQLVNFKISVDRANAVANELMRLLVPAGSIYVEARGASDLRYLESMPSGEAGNRRAEIFLRRS